MKVKIAMYKGVKSYYTRVLSADVFEDDDDYIRVSEIVEVDFPDLPKEEVSTKEIAIIRKAITNEMAESESRLNVLKQTLQERLAIGDDNGI